MLDTLGVDIGELIVIIALVSCWLYPAIFIDLYAARKLEEAKHRDIEQNSSENTR